MLSKEQEKVFFKMHEDGYSTKQIYEIMGISKSQAYNFIRKHGLKSNSVKCGLAPNDRKKIKELYKEGLTVREIHKLYSDKCSEGTVNNIIKDIARPRGKQAIIDHAYFEIIDTERKAYWLGFIYADGCVQYSEGETNSLAVEIKWSDKYLLEELAQDLASNLQPREVKTNNDRHGWKPKHNAKIAFHSKKLCEDLIKYGAVPNKTYKLNKLPNIPKHLIRHFIRGYFDGDGTIYKDKSCLNQPRTAFYGTYDFVSSIQKCLTEEIGLKSKTVTKQKEANVSFISYGVRETNTLCEWMYKDATIFLTRKYEIFIQNSK